MDKQIEASILDFKKITNQEQKLTPEEIKKFENVSFNSIEIKLHSFYPGETIIIERINPSEGIVIFQDSHGRNTEPLTNLGYELIGDNYVGKNILKLRYK